MEGREGTKISVESKRNHHGEINGLPGGKKSSLTLLWSSIVHRIELVIEDFEVEKIAQS